MGDGVDVRVLDDWLLTPQRAAIHVPTGMAVVADLHLGYERARQRRGEAIPTMPMEQRLAPLAALFLRTDVQRLVIAGDLFEEGRACAETAEELKAWLQVTGIELAGIVPGNHDGTLDGVEGLGPICPDGIALGRWRVVHGDGPTADDWVVFGHFHPSVRWGGRKAPCYLVGARQLVLPAFSLDAAGVNVLRERRWKEWRPYVIVGETVVASMSSGGHTKAE